MNYSREFSNIFKPKIALCNQILKIKNEMQQNPKVFTVCFLALFATNCTNLDVKVTISLKQKKNNFLKLYKKQQKSNIYIHLTTHKVKNDIIFEMLWIETKMLKGDIYLRNLELGSMVGLGKLLLVKYFFVCSILLPIWNFERNCSFIQFCAIFAACWLMEVG